MRDAPLQRTRHPDLEEFRLFLFELRIRNPTTVGFLLDPRHPRLSAAKI